MDTQAQSERSTVLIVDDNITGRMALEALLLREGYRLETAASGPEALEKAAALLPDLLLLDVMMPDMDGMEVCRRLRDNPKLAEMPIVMVTALSDDDSRVQGIEAGADDFISKPFSTAELRARVRTITRLNRYRRLAAEREQRQQAEAVTQRQLERLASLHAIDMDITAHLDLSSLLARLVEQIHHRIRVDIVAVLRFNPERQRLEYAALYGADPISYPLPDLPLEQTLSGQALLLRKLMYSTNMGQTNGTGALHIGPVAAVSPEIVQTLVAASNLAQLQYAGIESTYAVPLITRGQIKGVLTLLHRSHLAPDADWLEFLEILGGQAAVALDNADLFEHLQRSYEATLEGWVRALDLRDKETEGHSQRVTEMSVRLARAMGLDEEEIEHVRRGALLHDIGKLGIPDQILLKPGPLTEEEWVIMRTHPTLAYQWLSPIDYLRPALDIPYCHHEKWDGSGYPRGLAGEQIPLAARIFAVVDVWDALSSDRPYRKRWPDEKVHAHLCEQAGSHFDTQVVETFVSMVYASVLPN
jgi:response regulator RpfG family c-di-GMP phosphodiesterase